MSCRQGNKPANRLAWCMSLLIFFLFAFQFFAQIKLCEKEVTGVCVWVPLLHHQLSHSTSVNIIYCQIFELNINECNVIMFTYSVQVDMLKKCEPHLNRIQLSKQDGLCKLLQSGWNQTTFRNIGRSIETFGVWSLVMLRVLKGTSGAAWPFFLSHHSVNVSEASACIC